MSAGVRLPFDFAKFDGRLRPSIKKGFVDAARRIATPHIVQQNGLCEDTLGQLRYCEESEERRRWIEEHCAHEHEIEPIRDTRMRMIGFIFRFADADEAFAFRMRF